VQADGRFVILLLSFAVACNSSTVAFTEETPATGKNLNCSFDPQCSPDLVCAFGKCHRPCEVTRDCPAGERCIQVKGEDGGLLGQVCQLPDETACVRNSDCPGVQICGIDGRCRDQCATARDCLAQQVCVQHTCADPGDLDDAGMLGD
jgi:hypothetical protein